MKNATPLCLLIRNKRRGCANSAFDLIACKKTKKGQGFAHSGKTTFYQPVDYGRASDEQRVMMMPCGENEADRLRGA
jgi:hypothetical protein